MRSTAPRAVARRNATEAQREKNRLAWRFYVAKREREATASLNLETVLRQIAAGHGDPRNAARVAIKELDAARADLRKDDHND